MGNMTQRPADVEPNWSVSGGDHHPDTEYTIYTVVHRPAGSPAPADLSDATARIDDVIAAHPEVTLRGFYDLSNLHEHADLMVWVHGKELAPLQDFMRDLRTTPLFENLDVTWQVPGVHVAAEFNRMHAPAFLVGDKPLTWLCTYPFVRHADWYLMDGKERAVHLREHGMAASKFEGILANTVACFGMSNYEWMLAFEAEDPTQIVDLMRAMRYTQARRWMKHETPFFFGRRCETSELAKILRYEA
ncbi:chlorite dismutase [Actinotignum sanguinis]|nr:chlorite dismutase [Actinotignum sanguinis]